MLEIRNPASGEVIATLPQDNADSVAAGLTRAREAQHEWARLPVPGRVACITRFRGLLVENIEQLAHILTSEVGKPIRQARNEISAVLSRIDFFIEHAAAATAAETVFDDQGLRERITHEPLGVVACISAWNYPYFTGMNVLVPALLCGNAVLYKPSEFATLTGHEIVRLMHAAGVPEDVFIVLTGAAETGMALVDADVDGVFFTGSVATGKQVAQALGSRLIRMQLELGGKDPAYVCDDANVEIAAESLADGAMYNTGQSCCSVERIYVHESIYDQFVGAFIAAVQSFPVNDPLDESSYIGPLTRPAQIALLERQVADALAKGASLLCGGHALERPGYWFAPTVLVNVSHDMELMRDESFGPIIGIQKVADDNEAVHLMNDSRYGLTAAVFGPDEARAKRLLARVRAGSVYWNCCDRVSPRLPWSGLGDSGVGLTLSVYGFQTFTRPKAWHLRSP